MERGERHFYTPSLPHSAQLGEERESALRLALRCKSCQERTVRPSVGRAGKGAAEGGSEGAASYAAGWLRRRPARSSFASSPSPRWRRAWLTGQEVSRPTTPWTTSGTEENTYSTGSVSPPRPINGAPCKTTQPTVKNLPGAQLGVGTARTLLLLAVLNKYPFIA